MCELLIKAVDATHADPAKDARGCYKRGDIVDVRRDGFEWGAKELKAPADGGKFVVVKIPGVTAAQLRQFVKTKWLHAADGHDTDRRRRFRIDVHLLPLNVRQTLNQTGEFTTTWAALRQFLRNKANGETAANDPI